MALEYSEQSVTIICDKCGQREVAAKENYNDQFFESGWGLFMNARKHKHKCYHCMDKKSKSGHNFVKEHFYKPQSK